MRGRLVSTKIHHHLLGLPHVDEAVLWPTLVHEVLRQSSVFRVIVVADQTNDDRVVRT